MIACAVCGGVEPFLVGLGLLCLPFLGSLYHKIKHKCCKKSCKCDCHGEE